MVSTNQRAQRVISCPFAWTAVKKHLQPPFFGFLARLAISGHGAQQGIRQVLPVMAQDELSRCPADSSHHIPLSCLGEGPS